MNHELSAEVSRLGGDPTDPIWRWLLLNGPHGPSFTWGQAKSEPRGYVGVQHLRETVQERTTQDSTFPTRARSVAIIALRSSDVILVRRAIQVLGVVGSGSDLELLAPFANHRERSVAADARACVFELRQGMKER